MEIPPGHTSDVSPLCVPDRAIAAVCSHVPPAAQSGAQLSRESWQLMAPSRCSGAPTVPLAEEGRELLLLSNPKMIFGFPLTLHHPAADLPFSISDTSSKDITGHPPAGYSPPPRVAPFLLPFATCTNSSKFPPDNLGRLWLTPEHPGPRCCPQAPSGKPPARQGSCSSAVPCCPSHAVPDWQAACRGEGQSKAILNVKQAEKTLVPAFHSQN